MQGGQRGETSCSEVAQEEMEPNFSKVVTPALNKGEIRFTFAFIYIYIYTFKTFQGQGDYKMFSFFSLYFIPRLRAVMHLKGMTTLH